VAHPAVEAEPVNTTATIAEVRADTTRCKACHAEAPGPVRWTSAPGFAIAVLVVAIGVGFLIPILCSLLAIGVGMVAIYSSEGKGPAVKRLAVASVILGIVGVIGAIAVLSGA
jgi:4-hydroxybenzoate polyprenyltransferase